MDMGTPEATERSLTRLRSIRDETTAARFKEDTEAVERLQGARKTEEDKIRMGEGVLRAYIRELLM